MTYTVFTVTPIGGDISPQDDGVFRVNPRLLPHAPSTAQPIGALSFNVTNIASGYAVMLYVDGPGIVRGALTDFGKVFLQPGQSTTVTLHVHSHSVHGADGQLQPGRYSWHVGDDGPSGFFRFEVIS